MFNFFIRVCFIRFSGSDRHGYNDYIDSTWVYHSIGMGDKGDKKKMDKTIEILTLLKTEFDRPEAALDSHLYSDLHFDGVDMMQLIFALEEDYDIEIPDEDMAEWKTVEDVVEYVKQKEER